MSYRPIRPDHQAGSFRLRRAELLRAANPCGHAEEFVRALYQLGPWPLPPEPVEMFPRHGRAQALMAICSDYPQFNAVQ